MSPCASLDVAGHWHAFAQEPQLTISASAVCAIALSATPVRIQRRGSTSLELSCGAHNSTVTDTFTSCDPIVGQVTHPVRSSRPPGDSRSLTLIIERIPEGDVGSDLG